MRALVAGATGATGSLLVKQLLFQGIQVRAVVRNKNKLEGLGANLELIEGSLLDFSDEQMTELVKDCDAVISCLGHNISFKGIYGKPRQLVTDAVRRLSQAVERNKPVKPVKFVLMNTTGNRNRDLDEKVSFGHKVVVGLLRVLVPPHPDNEQAAEYLRVEVGQSNPFIEWVAVRPDGLVNETTVSEYVIKPSPTRDAIFDAGKVSRINVAHFMSDLISDSELWHTWKGQMPVIYSAQYA